MIVFHDLGVEKQLEFNYPHDELGKILIWLISVLKVKKNLEICQRQSNGPKKLKCLLFKHRIKFLAISSFNLMKNICQSLDC